ncbi:hypothetical protein EDD18DRAFT_1143610, partial [Armillaria luteobubalina]
MHGKLLFLSYIASVESFLPVGRHHMDPQPRCMLSTGLISSSAKHASRPGGKVYIRATGRSSTSDIYMPHHYFNSSHYTNMITNNQFIQPISYIFAIAIAMVLSALVFAQDILALLPFRAPPYAAPKYTPITVTVKVEVQYSTIEPSSCVSPDSTFVKVSSKCYSSSRVDRRS